ncbi:hypothetical protein HYU11_06335 [Candidatus Woesearchaeota archaeon]|nr:hypothetical protein [Candidatus Woesearchaeota archaeon]
MHIPKSYGKSRKDECPFCGRQATTTNIQSIPVCPHHRKNTLDNMKCACGSYLDVRKGKYGPFFACISCGAISISKALEINQAAERENPKREYKKNSKGEIEIRSDDPDFF